MREAGSESQIEPPHLQIVCNQLYSESRRRFAQQIKDGQPALITAELYDELGKAEGMLRGYLDDVVNRIAGGDEKQIGVVRSTLKLMIETVGTRKFVSLNAICGDLPDVPRDETVRLINGLHEARVIETRGSGDDRTYSLSHEIMVAKVESWFDEREMLRRRAQETLERGLAEWNSTNTTLTETQVENIRKWLPNRILGDAETLLQQSEWTIEKQKRRAAEQHQRLGLARRRTKTARRIAIVVAAILIPASTGFGIWAAVNANRAEAEAENARLKQEEADAKRVESEKLVAQGRIEKAITLCEQGRIREGVGVLYAAYELAKTPNHEPVRSSALDLIGSWSRVLGTLLQHGDKVNAVAISGDGKWALTGCEDNTARLWNAETGEAFGDPLPHEHPVLAVAIADSGRAITLSGGIGKSCYVRLWDGPTGNPLSDSLLHRGLVMYSYVGSAVAISRDGNWAIAGDRIWHIETDKVTVMELPANGTQAVAISADGARAITGGHDGMARFWDAKTGEKIWEKSHDNDEIMSVAISSDGHRAIIGNQKKVAYLYDVETHLPIGDPLPHCDVVMVVAISADGTRAITGDASDFAHLWDATDGRRIGAPLPHQRDVHGVAHQCRW